MEISIKYTELIMVAIIIVQIIALITQLFNIKLLKNGLQEKKKKPKIFKEIKNTVQPLSKRKKTTIRNQENTTKEELPTVERRSTPLKQRDDYHV